MIVAVGLLVWQLTTGSSYRVKNRDRPHMDDRGTKPKPRDGKGPSLSDMLD